MSRTAKLFSSGGSQAVRLPAEFRFQGDEVFIHREGDRVILSPKPTSWVEFLAVGPRASVDYMRDVDDAPLPPHDPV